MPQPFRSSVVPRIELARWLSCYGGLGFTPPNCAGQALECGESARYRRVGSTRCVVPWQPLCYRSSVHRETPSSAQLLGDVHDHIRPLCLRRQDQRIRRRRLRHVRRRIPAGPCGHGLAIVGELKSHVPSRCDYRVSRLSLQERISRSGYEDGPANYPQDAISKLAQASADSPNGRSILMAKRKTKSISVGSRKRMF